MLDLHSWVWGTDIELALMTIRPATCKDPEYWFATVDRIEQGKHPDKPQNLTMDALREWSRRCTEGADHHADHTGEGGPEDRYVPDLPKTVHPRNRGPLL